MKTNFKKTLAVLLAVLMLTSVFSVTAFAAFTAKIQPGSAAGVTRKETLEDGTPITDNMLSLKTNSSNKLTLPKEAYFEREGYVQDGWTKTASGGGSLLKFGASQTVRNNTTKFYPHWKQVVFDFSLEAGSNYDASNPDNYTDASMTELKSWSVVVDTRNPQQITLPGAMYVREGYVQTGWCTTMFSEGEGEKYEFGSVYDEEFTKDVTLYPFWKPLKYTLRFDGGEFGVGTAQEDLLNYGTVVTAPGAIFTREGYLHIGWSTTDGSSEVQVALGGNVPALKRDVTYYPVWLKEIYEASISKDTFKFGTVCNDYAPYVAEEVIIENLGNMDLVYTLPTSPNYDIEIISGDTALAPNESFVFTVKPKDDLPLNDYSEALVIDCDSVGCSFVLNLNFKVLEHSFGRHKSNNDATYTKDGTKTAICLNGCGEKDTIADPGSMKVYSIDNNTAAGLAPSYIHHRTVRFTAFGSGMDAAEEDKLTKRFRPVSWYVNDEFNGEFTGNQFENGYDVTFTHTIFGKYTLIINYVEEELDATTGEWVATEVTDTKTFEYTVGTTAEEEQEIVRPNTILSIIFGLFAELLKLLGIGG